MSRNIHVERELPIVVEGFVESYENVVDETERGIIMEVITYLGCPIFNQKPALLGWQRFGLGNVTYNLSNDISHILAENHGKFLRITIEAIGVGSGADCDTCKERFRCLTMKRKEGHLYG